MRLALGLFHFNPHWGGELRSAHRHCSEAIGPFLQVLASHPHWKVSFNISGSGLEFLKQNYPSQLNNIRRLADRGQLELISALYTPSVWVAFSRRELLESIARNRRCVESLRLPSSRIFFAQEAFYGEAVHTLADHFDIAVCKDDYVNHFVSFDFDGGCYRAGDMKIVVGSGHLMNESLAAWQGEPGVSQECGLTTLHRRHIKAAEDLNAPQSFPGRSGRCGKIEWLWYHCGDGNHFSAIFKPQDHERCYRDPVWERWCETLLTRVEAREYRLATIREFAGVLDYSGARQFPVLPEGSWNPKRAAGVLRWMGGQATASANHTQVLTAAVRARERILQAERVIANTPAPPASFEKQRSGLLARVRRRISRRSSSLDPDAVPPLGRAWDALLHAQISDCLGWFPTSESCGYSLAASDRALALATRALEATGERCVQCCPAASVPTSQVTRELPEGKLVGAIGAIAATRVSQGHHIVEAAFQVVEETSGIGFPFSVPRLLWCPSGAECSPMTIDLAALKPDIITLPLSNGLLMIAPDIYLIKELRYVHVAGQINRQSRRAEFQITKGRRGKEYLWRFHIVTAKVEDAVLFANRLNCTWCPECDQTRGMCSVRRGMKERESLGRAGQSVS